MNETIKDIKKSIKDLQDEIDTKETKLERLFKEGLIQLLGAQKDIKSVSCHLNNHEFNDGDQTYFSLNYDDLTLTSQNDEEYDGYYGDKPTDKQKEYGLIAKSFVEFFKSFDIKSFYENMFGEYQERISFSLDGEKLEIG